MAIPNPTNPKQTAHQLIDKLPDDATWDDVVYKLITRREIELGLVDRDIKSLSRDNDAIRRFSRCRMNNRC